MVKAHDTNKLPSKPFYVIVICLKTNNKSHNQSSTFPEQSLSPKTQLGTQEMIMEAQRKNSYTQRITKTRGGGSISIWIKCKIQKSLLCWGWWLRNPRTLKWAVTKNITVFKVASLHWLYSTVKHILPPCSLRYILHTAYTLPRNLLQTIIWLN